MICSPAPEIFAAQSLMPGRTSRLNNRRRLPKTEAHQYIFGEIRAPAAALSANHDTSCLIPDPAEQPDKSQRRFWQAALKFQLCPRQMVICGDQQQPVQLVHGGPALGSGSVASGILCLKIQVNTTIKQLLDALGQGQLICQYLAGNTRPYTGYQHPAGRRFFQQLQTRL